MSLLFLRVAPLVSPHACMYVCECVRVCLLQIAAQMDDRGLGVGAGAGGARSTVGSADASLLELALGVVAAIAPNAGAAGSLPLCPLMCACVCAANVCVCECVRVLFVCVCLSVLCVCDCRPRC